LGGMTTAGFLYMGASASFFLAVYSLTLPNTPPKPVSAEGRGDALGLGALKLFRDPVFLIFVACAFVASIPACNYYFPAMGKMLSERDYPSPLSLGTLNQVSELLFMAALPFFVVRLGLKRVLLIGMLAWAVRYLCFTQDAFGFALVGLLLHGFCYSFLYVGAYMYGEKKAPEDLKASVQSLLTFLLLGVGQMLGAQWEGFAERRAAPAFTEMQIAASEAGVQMPGWVNPKLQDSNFKYLDLSGNVKRWMGQDQAAQLKDIGTELDSNQDNILTREELAAVDDKGVTFGETNFTRDDLLANFKAIAAWKAEKKPDEVGDDWQVARDDYIAAQRADWAQVFLVPSLFIFAVAAVFLIFGKDPEAEDKQ
ncbi:MAG: MFS transporter, partial [Planctomycetota bacterium]|nr:MFS transporter [Planctomycetota bacterium]